MSRSAASSLSRSLHRICALRSTHGSLPIASMQASVQHQHRAQSTTAHTSSQATISNLLTTHPTLSTLLPPLGSWRLTPTALERTFTFRTFRHAWSFMTLVSAYASKSRHHPEWSNIYNKVFVRWTTHDAQGLSGKDVEAAKAVDDFAVKITSEDGKGKGGDVTGDGGDVRGLVEEVRPKGGERQMGAAGEEAKKLKEKEKIEREEGADGKEGSLAGIGGQPT